MSDRTEYGPQWLGFLLCIVLAMIGLAVISAAYVAKEQREGSSQDIPTLSAEVANR